MAKIMAPSMRDRIYAGSHGNLSLAFASVELSGADVNDEVDLLELPIGLKITGVRVITDGLGVGTKVDIAVGSKALADDINVADAQAVSQIVKPVYLTEKVNLTAMVKGAKATGELHVILEYVNTGF